MKAWLRKFGIAFHRELPKKLLDIGTTAVGLLIALVLNGWADDRKEQETYRSMLLAIHSEARANETVISDSFEKFFRNGIVVRSFDTSTTTQLLANPLFMKHARKEDIETLGLYLRDISLSNGYRRLSEDLTVHGTPFGVSSPWLEGINGAWQDRVEGVRQSIRRVLEIKG